MSGKDNTALLSATKQICDSFDNHSSENLIPILQSVQDKFGYLPPEGLMEVSRITGIPASQIYGVATFYEQFHLEPRGRHIIKCCRGTACHVKGGGQIINALKEQLGVEDGGTTDDLKFTFETVACLGTCFLAPVIMINEDYYGNVTPDSIRSILKKYD